MIEWIAFIQEEDLIFEENCGKIFSVVGVGFSWMFVNFRRVGETEFVVDIFLHVGGLDEEEVGVLFYLKNLGSGQNFLHPFLSLKLVQI